MSFLSDHQEQSCCERGREAVTSDLEKAGQARRWPHPGQDGPDVTPWKRFQETSGNLLSAKGALAKDALFRRGSSLPTHPAQAMRHATCSCSISAHGHCSRGVREVSLPGPAQGPEALRPTRARTFSPSGFHGASLLLYQMS